MKITTLCLLILISLPCLATSDNAISTMASVLSELQHFPSADNKKALVAISQDASSTANEKLMAQIISRIAHKATDADKLTLRKILADKDASEAIKTITRAVINTMHTPQPEDLQALKALLN